MSQTIVFVFAILETFIFFLLNFVIAKYIT